MRTNGIALAGLALWMACAARPAQAQVSVTIRFLEETARIYTTWKPLFDNFLEEVTDPSLGSQTTKSFDRAVRDIDRAVNAIPREVPTFPTEVYEMSATSCRLTPSSLRTMEDIRQALANTQKTTDYLTKMQSALSTMKSRQEKHMATICEALAYHAPAMCAEFIEHVEFDVQNAFDTCGNGLVRLGKIRTHLERELARRQQGKAECDMKEAEAEAAAAERQIADAATPPAPDTTWGHGSWPQPGGQGGPPRMSAADCARQRQWLAKVRSQIDVNCGNIPGCREKKRQAMQAYQAALAQTKRVCG